MFISIARSLLRWNKKYFCAHRPLTFKCKQTPAPSELFITVFFIMMFSYFGRNGGAHKKCTFNLHNLTRFSNTRKGFQFKGCYLYIHCPRISTQNPESNKHNAPFESENRVAQKKVARSGGAQMKNGCYKIIRCSPRKGDTPRIVNERHSRPTECIPVAVCRNPATFDVCQTADLNSAANLIF